jgi:hypothetical protein
MNLAFAGIGAELARVGGARGGVGGERRIRIAAFVERKREIHTQRRDARIRRDRFPEHGDRIVEPALRAQRDALGVIGCRIACHSADGAA